LSDPSDEALLADYREGDSRAFETLLARYRGPIFNFLLRSARDRGRAEELYQDVWMKVIERCDEFRGDAKFSTWLYTIARNLCIDHQRKMKFRGHASLDAPLPMSGQPIGEGVSGFGPSTEQLASGGLLRERIGRAVEGLPEEQREVFLLRQLQGLAFREIAEVVGAPANTVKSRMRYALERLQHLLSDLEEPHEL
jgi:RNA polymerase sigma-70 factor (ECF subfamily)